MATKAFGVAAAKAALAAAKSYFVPWGRRNLLFGLLPHNNSMPLDEDLDPILDPFLGEVKVGGSTIYAGDMTGYPDEGLGTEGVTVNSQEITITALDHQCKFRFSECPVTTVRSEIPIEIGGKLTFDMANLKVWGVVNMKSGGLLTLPFISRKVNMGFNGKVFDRNVKNKLDITSAFSFCGLVKATGGMHHLPMKWDEQVFRSPDIYGLYVTDGKFDLAQFLPTFLTVGKYAIPETSREALKLDPKKLPNFVIAKIPGYEGKIGQALESLGKKANVDTTCEN